MQVMLVGIVFVLFRVFPREISLCLDNEVAGKLPTACTFNTLLTDILMMNVWHEAKLFGTDNMWLPICRFGMFSPTRRLLI